MDDTAPFSQVASQFGLTADPSSFRAATARFAADVLKPNYKRWDREGRVPPEIRRQMGELSLIGVEFPTEHGGLGADHVTSGVVLEAIAEGDFNAGYILLLGSLCGAIVTRHASRPIALEVLPKVVSGEKLLAVALTEPRGGSDTASLELKATRAGDHYVLDGRKDLDFHGRSGGLGGRLRAHRLGGEPRPRRLRLPCRHEGARRFPHPLLRSRRTRHRSRLDLLRRRARSRDASARERGLRLRPGDAGLRLLVLPAILGATAVLQDIFVAEAMAKQITTERATFTMGATPFLNDLADFCIATGTTTPSLRLFVSAGAPIPRPLVAEARRALGAAVLSAWGMSENGAVTTTRVEDSEEKVTTTDGCPLPGMEVRVVDAAGGVVPSGEEGRLQVRRCSNFIGYLKRPGLAQIDAEGWFETGDIARMDVDGYIRIAGRAKDIIIRGGENIPVYEVEALLFKHPAVAAVAVVGYPDERLGERACAFVIPRKDASLSLREMVDYLKAQKMAVQYIPERLAIVAELPRTPSGKIQKFKLREIVKTPTDA